MAAFTAQDELSRAEFLDVVLNDNELHYTTLPKFPFYVQTLDDLLDRIQANLDKLVVVFFLGESR